MKPFTSKHMNSSPLNQNEYGESRGEGHESGKRFRYDPADKKNFQALNQKTKDSLQGEAYKYNKPFFSPKHGVNVDPEDGVLSNRPVYSDNTKLTYDKIDKPFSKSGINRDSMRGVNPDNIKPIPQEHKDAAKLGAAGNIGVIGGAAGAVGKAAARAAAKKTFAKNNPGVTLGGATKNLPKGTGKPRYGKGNINPVITGGRSMKGMQSSTPKKKPFLDKAFDALGEAAVQYKNRLPWQ